MKVLALIVTHNRSTLLERCLDHLISQSRPPDEILVINNGSTDNTALILKARGITSITQENLGAAAGWHRGIEYALTRDFDSVWLMDDDGYPDSSALELLIPRLAGPTICACSVVVREDSKDRFVFPFPVLDRQNNPRIIALPRKIKYLTDLVRISPGGTYPFAHFFNGTLISLSAVRRVGNINQDYFIYGDEVDYFQRLRSDGKVVSVVDAYHYHPDVTSRPFNLPKVYYYIRNTLFLDNRYSRHSYLKIFFRIPFFVFEIAARNGLGFTLDLLFGRNSRVFYRAIFHGLRGRLGSIYTH